MADLYNTSFMDNVTNPLDIITGLGVAIGNDYLIGNLLLFAFFLIFLILTFKHGFLEILVIDSFISTIIAVLFFITGMISAATIIYPFIILVLALVFYLFS